MVGGGEAVCSGTVMRDSLSEAAVSNGEAADSNGIVIAGTETRYRGGWKRIDWLIPGVARLISVAWLISIQVFTTLYITLLFNALFITSLFVTTMFFINGICCPLTHGRLDRLGCKMKC